MIEIVNKKLAEKTKGYCDIIDITAKVREQIQKERVQTGVVTLFVTGSTAALTTVEYEPGLVQDLRELLERLIPSDKKYHHDERWGDNNGFSHVRGSLFGPSLQIPIEDSRLLLGTWQQIVLLDFDNRSRRREIALQIIGDIE